MRRLLTALSLALSLSGCLTTQVDRAGGPGGITVKNTNTAAIAAAATPAFASIGYTPGPSNYPSWIAFDKPANTFSRVMWGSYGNTLSIRAKLVMQPIPGSNDVRIIIRASRVTNAGEAGFEDSVGLASFWSSQFRPVLRQIQSNAAGAGPGPGSAL